MLEKTGSTLVLLINKTKDLVEFLTALGRPPYVALDTEFISEKTYYPQLCLLQIGYGKQAAVIDTLTGLDMQPLFDFLQNPDMVKVFHAAEQDLVILWNDFKLSLSPLFDTQIAAMVCGFGDQVSYAQLVRAFTNDRIDKSSQIVDWSKRPLRQRHIDYALADVIHLGPVYEGLVKRINQQQRSGWIAEEMEDLSNSERFLFKPESQTKKLKLRNMTPRRMAVLHNLIHWREEQAKDQNLPRGWVLKDLALRDLVSNPPTNMQDLNRARGIGGNSQGRTGQAILKTIQDALDLPLAQCPPISTDKSEDEVNSNAMVLLRALQSHVCETSGVAPKLLASKHDLEQVSLGRASRLSSGWRDELFGQLARELIAGKLSLTLTNGQIDLRRA